MKVIDKDARKMRLITNLEEDGIKMPYWITDDKQEIILKCKDKFCVCIEPLEPGKSYTVNTEFQSYCIENRNEEPIKGYFLKVPQMKPCGFDVDVDNTDYFLVSF